MSAPTGQAPQRAHVSLQVRHGEFAAGPAAERRRPIFLEDLELDARVRNSSKTIFWASASALRSASARLASTAARAAARSLEDLWGATMKLDKAVPHHQTHQRASLSQRRAL